MQTLWLTNEVRKPTPAYNIGEITILQLDQCLAVWWLCFFERQMARDTSYD